MNFNAGSSLLRQIFNSYFFCKVNLTKPYDPYDFDPSNRGLVGESLTWLGRNRCPDTGKPFNIYIEGSEALSLSGQAEGATKCECGR